MRVGLAAVLVCMAATVAAETVDQSPRPVANPRYAVVAEVPVGVRPKRRPDGLAEVAMAEDLAAVPPPSRKELRRKKRDATSTKGSVCGVAAIKGEVIAPITSRIKGCGVAEPVRVTAISGVRLSQSPTIDCATAKALNTWVTDVVQPAFGGSVVELSVAAHYICRSRNNIPGAQISEHGKGKAIDISAFVLASGKVLTVLDNYNKTLRKVHKGACGIFKTTLGPGSDGYHENHIHLDTSGRKGGVYCR